MSKKTDHIDWFILLSVVGLMLFSVAFVYSASAAFADAHFGSSEKLVVSHGIRVVLGLFAVFIFARIDYHVWERLAKPAYIISIGLLAIVLVSGARVKGATRWIDIGYISFQPSELAKFALVMFVSAMLAERTRSINDFKRGILPIILWTLPCCGLIALQPNVSTAGALFLMMFVLLFVGNARTDHLSVIGFFTMVFGGIYALAAPYRRNRILAFLGLGDGMENNAVEKINYQLKQALIAFGNGGITGVGPGRSIQRDFFLPESYGDFIYSIIGEEYGLIGATIVLIAFGILLWRGLAVAKRAPDAFGRLLAAGITIVLVVYAVVNAGVTCGVLPTTGLPMPFISYGGTSVLFSSAAVGILLNISSHAGVYPRRRNITSIE